MDKLSGRASEPSDPNDVWQQRAFFTSDQVTIDLMDTLPQGIAILNRSLQLVAANAMFLKFAGAPSAESLVGAKLDAALVCSHFGVEPYGGTGNCLSCPIRMALMAAAERRRYLGECQILRVKGEAQGTRELRLSMVPLESVGGSFTVVSVEDIGLEKRLQSLESIFHHDLRNTAGILQGAVAALNDHNYAEVADQLNRLIASSSDRLVNEIESQDQLLKAERGLAELDVEPFRSQEVLDEVAALYDARAEYHSCRVLIAEESTPFIWESDRVIVGRILGNMVKNGLEACRPGDTVTVGADASDIGCRFWVHNPASMPESMRDQMFQHSYTTKGSGRGLGTYGMKMLSERYLGGLIGFSSSAEAGTTFELTLPRTP